ncbi:hypothetical protein FHU41_001223 [Psychromicrobium silvestre]|uniref:Outer membrane channel protein CpnT-like N-terminal domain-containing protein n=1 Tax=Psychromicrobium silvestre TaxID=1645614 RepID=A0A7Y9S817_9MICC|nr:hypothetical protein [Psychromicrobium silvestre]NYE95002.1 hypothetical protein [Psychromicrobium silvestre]
MRLLVRTASYVEAAEGLVLAQHGVDQVHSALLAGLAGTETMAGNDDGGIRFAGEYNPAAQDVVMGISAARTGCGVLAKRLADTANVWADAEHYASGGRSPMGMAAVSADISDASMGCSAMVPSAVGQSMGLPEGWEWIQSVCGAVWPNGDPDRLRKAAGAWKQAGNDLNSVADRLGNAQTPLLSLVTPDLNLILTKLGEFKAFVQETAQHCTDIGDACDSYAAGLDEAHNSIRTELAELLAFTVAFEAGAALLAVFTVGASEVVGNVAVVGRIALAGTRVAGIITRVGATAASIAGRISSAAAAIGRTTALVRELAVIKNITYLGSKAPAWVKLTTSMTVNTGVSVGIDAAANGGKVNHFGADLAAGFLPFGLGKITTGLKGAEAAAAANAAGDLGKVTISSPAFGGPFRVDYRKTFFEANPTVPASSWVHHAIEQQVLKKYPGLFTKEQLNSLFNLRGIPIEVNSAVHLKAIRDEWDDFYEAHPPSVITPEAVIDFKVYLDKKYGDQFNPKVK